MLDSVHAQSAKQINHVHKTTDYFLFKSIDGNRNKNMVHLERLKQSMSKNYLFTIIIVNEKYEIIDGQHRFECIKELGLPLYYVVCVGYGLNEVQVLNQNSKTWTSDDYMDGYCNMGRDQYVKYKSFKQKYKFGHNECMAMLTGVNASGGRIVTEFKSGEFKVTHLKEAQEKAEKITSLKAFYDGYRRRSFIYAMLYLFDRENFDFDEFYQKLKNRPSAMTDCTDMKQYLVLIEEIYNYRRKDKANLRF